MIFFLLTACQNVDVGSDGPNKPTIEHNVENRQQEPSNHGDHGDHGPNEIDPDLHIPSSFVQMDEHTVESMKERIGEAIEAKHPLHKYFGRRSRSPVVAEGLNLQAGDILADIGAGTGAFELLLLEGGYEFERVIAIDTDKGPLDFLQWMVEAAELDYTKLLVVNSRGDDISLEKESVTKALLLNTPFYLNLEGKPTIHPSTRKCMKSIVDALKPGGELHIVERHVGEKEEDLKIDDPPEMHCTELKNAFTPFGMTLKTMEMVQLAKEGEPAHCRVILTK